MSTQLFFVYGTLKRKESAHARMQGATFRGEACTEGGYDLFNLGRYPAMTVGVGQVHGELYDVDDQLAAALDAFEGVPHLYFRQVVTLANGRQANAYLMHPQQVVGASRLEDGRWESLEPPTPAPMWCVVANVAPYQEYGEQREIRLGTRHFSPNTKVYCFPPGWGDGYEDIRVIGRHRGSARLATIIMPSRRLTNWRVKLVYQPHVLKMMADERWNEADARAMVTSLRLWEAARVYWRQGLSFAPPNEALVFAAMYGQPDEVSRALERGASLETVVQGWTPLTAAAVWGNAETVELLLARGANPHHTNYEDQTAVGLARRGFDAGKRTLLEQADHPSFIEILRGWWSDVVSEDRDLPLE